MSSFLLSPQQWPPTCVCCLLMAIQPPGKRRLPYWRPRTRVSVRFGGAGRPRWALVCSCGPSASAGSGPACGGSVCKAGVGARAPGPVALTFHPRPLLTPSETAFVVARAATCGWSPALPSILSHPPDDRLCPHLLPLTRQLSPSRPPLPPWLPSWIGHRHRPLTSS